MVQGRCKKVNSNNQLHCSDILVQFCPCLLVRVLIRYIGRPAAATQHPIGAAPGARGCRWSCQLGCHDRGWGERGWTCQLGGIKTAMKRVGGWVGGCVCLC
jgi:hypothetical protein